MKPEWCPQEIWVAAQSEADQYVEWLIPKPKEYSQSEHVLAVSFARVILDAHQRGRREGMEEAAEVVRQQVPTIPVDGPTCLGQEAEYFALGHALIAIRAKAQEVKT